MILKILAVYYDGISNAIRGLVDILKHERNSPAYLISMAGCLILGLALNISRTDWLWILLAITMVWATEIINTAIEHVTDLACPNHHPLARRAKDAAAAACLIVVTAALLIGVLVFTPYLY